MRYLRSMLGLGDTIYVRAVARELGPMYLETAWPQLFVDMPQILPVRPTTSLRTQARNIEQWAGRWHRPNGYAAGRIGYDGAGTLLGSIARSVGLSPARVTFDLPMVGPAHEGAPYIVVRPATVRKEWRADARNPHPSYIDQAARAAALEGYTIITIGDLADGQEWPAEPLPFAHTHYMRGEWSTDDMLGILAGASGVIGGVGWALPATLAYRVPMLCIWGGWGFANGPQRVLDPRLPTESLVAAVPDALCMCDDRFHDCDRVITHFGDDIERFICLIRERATAVAA